MISNRSAVVLYLTDEEAQTVAREINAVLRQTLRDRAAKKETLEIRGLLAISSELREILRSDDS